MTRIIPNDLEAGGALKVVFIQFAITPDAFAGGLLFDNCQVAWHFSVGLVPSNGVGCCRFRRWSCDHDKILGGT